MTGTIKLILSIFGAVGAVLLFIVLIYMIIALAIGGLNKWQSFINTVKNYLGQRESMYNEVRQKFENKSNAKSNFIKTLWLTYRSNSVAVALVTAIVVATLFILIIVISKKTLGSNTICPENVVLTFVGILSTFIVVTNYAQVVNIKDEFSQKNNALQSSLKEVNSTIQNQVNAIQEVKVRYNDLIEILDAVRTPKLSEIAWTFAEALKIKHIYYCSVAIPSMDNPEITEQIDACICVYNNKLVFYRKIDNETEEIVPVKIKDIEIKNINKFSKLVLVYIDNYNLLISNDKGI